MTGRSPRRWRWVLQVVGTCIVVLGVALIGQPASAQVPPLATDKYPGFGRSPEAALRDDTIAYWEAFRREQLVASCMHDAGFVYAPAVAFPTEALVAVAAGLGVVASPAPPSTLMPPSLRNQLYEAALSPDDRNGFNRALFAETATDIAEANRSGAVPVGRGEDFASGGCVGVATSTVPSIWDLRRALADDFVGLHRDVASSPELDQTRAEFARCARGAGGIAADDPNRVEDQVANGWLDPVAAAGVLQQCGETWAVGYRRAEAAAVEMFVERNSAALNAAEERYRGAIDTIRSDTAFLAYLSEEVALAGLTSSVAHPEGD